MNDIQVDFGTQMLSYPGYPTPPSTSEDSPLSYSTLSPASIISDASSTGAFPGGHVVLIAQNSTILPFQGTIQTMTGIIQSPQPYLEITEQPVDRFRFRYKSEMTGTHGCLNGEKSDKTRKMTYPSVKLHNHKEPAVIRCSIWQINHKGNDCMPHAHRLVKKKHGKEETDDPHELTIDADSKHEASFFSMGIIHTAKKNIVSELIKKKTAIMREAAVRENRSLTKKEEMEIKGLAEAESKSINLNVVCLRFDAYYATDKELRVPICNPVFSHAINNLKSALTGELKIVRMDHCTSPAKGGREIFLLVERVTKKNIRIRFYELNDKDECIWEDFGKFSDLDVHHQYAIVFRTPKYRDGAIGTPVNVFMELVRPTDNATSEPKVFTYVPCSDWSKPGSKRSRPNDFDSNEYDTSSSIGSGGIPRTIQNISEEMKSVNISKDKFSVNLNTDHLDSSEIDKLLSGVDDYDMERIDSKELTDLFNSNRSEYELLFQNNISTDVAAHGMCSRNTSLSRSGEQYHPMYKKKILRVIHEITEFLKTKPTKEDTIKHIRHYLLNFSDKYNAFHMAAMVGDRKTLEFFMKLIVDYEQFDLVNVLTKTGDGTVLHLAVLHEDVELVQYLVKKCFADITLQNQRLNTPIHLAVLEKNPKMLECLLQGKQHDTYIDRININGNTPLHRAVKRGYLKAAKLLCQYGSDVNYPHHANGHTPLRLAVDRKDFEMIKFLLSEPRINPKEPDFAGVNPLQVVDPATYPPEIVQLVQKYTEENNILTEDIDIKEEPEDEESEDEKEIFEEEVKAEPLPLGDDYTQIFQDIPEFTEECLNDISKEIDSSGKWQDLARLLDIEHLIRMETIDEGSPGRRILEIATQIATIKEIRGFLEDLDESKAVLAIDRMALYYHNKSEYK